jgi:hypothetical protein
MSNDNEPADITKGEVKQIIEQNRMLAQQVQQFMAQAGEQPEEPKRRPGQKRNRFVDVLFLDNEPVVGLKNRGSDRTVMRLEEVEDPKMKGHFYMLADVVTRNKDGKETVHRDINWLELTTEGDHKSCPVLKSRSETWYIDLGRVMQQKLEEGKYTMKETDIEVDQTVTGKESFFVVDIDGTPVEIHEDYVNIVKTAPERVKTYEGTSEIS